MKDARPGPALGAVIDQRSATTSPDDSTVPTSCAMADSKRSSSRDRTASRSGFHSHLSETFSIPLQMKLVEERQGQLSVVVTKNVVGEVGGLCILVRVSGSRDLPRIGRGAQNGNESGAQWAAGLWNRHGSGHTSGRIEN